MGFRTVLVTRRSKLDYKMDYLVIRTEDKTTRVHLSEISVLMIESTAVSLTSYLLAELAKHKIRVIFCDGEHNPYGELCPYYGSHDTSRKLRQQIGWTGESKKFVWAEIVRAKLLNQIANLPPNSREAEKLTSYFSHDRGTSQFPTGCHPPGTEDSAGGESFGESCERGNRPHHRSGSL